MNRLHLVATVGLVILALLVPGSLIFAAWSWWRESRKRRRRAEVLGTISEAWLKRHGGK